MACYYYFITFPNRDIAKYNTDEDMEESIEETGWKLVHGDVFRPPQFTRCQYYKNLHSSSLKQLQGRGIRVTIFSCHFIFFTTYEYVQ